MKKLLFYIVLFLINNFLKGTKLFKLKRRLLINIGVSVGSNSKIVGPIYINYINKISIGEECWVGKNFTVDGNGSVIIEDRCDIGPNLIINTGGHVIGDSSRRAGAGIRYKSCIKSGSWIGSNVLIVNGSQIGESSVVAAGTVVISDVKPNVLLAGVPGKVKKELN